MNKELSKEAVKEAIVNYLSCEYHKAVSGGSGSEVSYLVTVKELEDDLKYLSVFIEFIGEAEEIIEAAAMVLI